MTTARYPQVTDELLSAYIDDAVTAEERLLVETAADNDPDVAWRLASLRATIVLLRQLPTLALPRSFVLAPEQLQQRTSESADSPATLTPALRTAKRRPAAKTTGFWPRLHLGWQNFWSAGSPALRNAMAASFALLIVLMIGPRVLQGTNSARLGQRETAAAPVAAPAATFAVVEPSVGGAATQAQAPVGVPDLAEAQPTAQLKSADVPADAQTVGSAVTAQADANQLPMTKSSAGEGNPGEGSAPGGEITASDATVAGAAEDSAASGAPASDAPFAATDAYVESAPAAEAGAAALPSVLPTRMTEAYAANPAHPAGGQGGAVDSAAAAMASASGNAPPAMAAAAAAAAPPGPNATARQFPAPPAAPAAAMEAAPASAAGPMTLSASSSASAAVAAGGAQAQPAGAAGDEVTENGSETTALIAPAAAAEEYPAPAEGVALTGAETSTASMRATSDIETEAAAAPATMVTGAATPTSLPTATAEAMSTPAAVAVMPPVTAAAGVSGATAVETTAGPATSVTAAPAATGGVSALQLAMPWLQLAFGLATLCFGLLWWRSRR